MTGIEDLRETGRFDRPVGEEGFGGRIEFVAGLGAAGAGVGFDTD